MSSKAKRRKCLIVDIGPEDISELEKAGFTNSGDPSWRASRRNNDGFLSLLAECKIPGPLEFLEMQFRRQAPTKISDGYFREIADQIVAKAADGYRVVVINLMPFLLCRTLVDKITFGLFDGVSYPPGLEFVLLLRNLDWVERSAVFQDIRRQGRLKSFVTIIDLRGYGSRYMDDSAPEMFQINRREPFRAILPCTEKKIYKALISETNNYIGHFVLKNSHVRTHYSLDQFIARDDVWEFLIDFFAKQIGDAKNALLVGLGMEHGAIDQIGERLKYIFGDRCVITFKTAAHSDAQILENRQHFDRAYVVTDIVNTGMTAAGLAQRLSAESPDNKTVHVLAIARMMNSPGTLGDTKILSALHVQREFYPADETKCPLCQLSQPKVSVNKVEDFAKIADEQLTPFDFWELAKDSKALEESRTDTQGRKFHFRVETLRIMDGYRPWLMNLVKAKFEKQLFKHKADIICTVDEVGGKAFADLVREALAINAVVAVGRTVLDRTTTRLPSGPGLSPKSTVLIVDDGMNSGSTVKQLITYATASGAIPMAVMVLDNRLRNEELQSLEKLIGRDRILSLYSWPKVFNIL